MAFRKSAFSPINQPLLYAHYYNEEMKRTSAKAEKEAYQSIEQEVLQHLARTFSRVLGEFELLIKSEGLSFSQYNILRILRGVTPLGLGRNEIRDRLMTRLPDVTRLLDRLENAGLVRRQRDGALHRVVPTFITKAGLALLKKMDEPVQSFAETRLKDLSDKDRQALVRLLNLIYSDSPKPMHLA